MYHSYEVLDDAKQVNDFNGDKAFVFGVVLGGEDLLKVRDSLLNALEEGLDKEGKY